jgi:UDP-glucose 4-epimerase
MAVYLVTGGAGFVGSHLVEDLTENGHQVRVLDNLSTGSRDNVPPGVDFVVGDVIDREAVEAAFENVDGCFHLAAIASVERCHREWLLGHQVNLTGTINIFDCARQSRLGRPVPVVYASSAAVYGNPATSPISEECPVNPLSAYGADKAACEMHARIAGSVHGVPAIGVRFFNIYGPRQDPRSPYSSVISIFVDRLLAARPIEIFGDGEQVRDFTFVGDAIAALRRAMAEADTQASVLNICSGIGTSIRQLADEIAELCHTGLVVNYLAPRCGDIRISVGDPSLAAERLDFRARTRLRRGLAVTLGSLQGRPKSFSSGTTAVASSM